MMIQGSSVSDRSAVKAYEVHTLIAEHWALRSVFDDMAAALADARSLSLQSRQRAVRVIETTRDPGSRPCTARILEAPARADQDPSALIGLTTPKTADATSWSPRPLHAPFIRLALAAIAIVAAGIAAGAAFGEARRLAW